jgi:serine/threonine protein kinase
VVYEELGVGGMATVHRAEMRGVEGFRKEVALKRLHPYLAATPDIVQSFVREAQLASRLHHTNIAQTFELGKADDNYFISMEYVPGPTLTQVMRQCQIAAGAIPLPVTLGILTQICEALDYAHCRTDDDGKLLGIIHRDVSPSNVVISNTGIVKLLDFGIAKVTSRQDLDTPVGIVIKGKFDYIAPEYLGGGKLDLRADLFALGVIAHELLTGRKLFAGKDDFETTTMVLEMPIPPPSRGTPGANELDVSYRPRCSAIRIALAERNAMHGADRSVRRSRSQHQESRVGALGVYRYAKEQRREARSTARPAEQRRIRCRGNVRLGDPSATVRSRSRRCTASARSPPDWRIRRVDPRREGLDRPERDADAGANAKPSDPT